MNKSGIYTITNTINGKVYVGKSIDYRTRLSVHKNKLVTGIHKNPHLQSAVNIYGIDTFLFELLEECREEYLNSLENYWCNILDSHNREFGYNLTATSPIGTGRIPKESCDKISKALKGKLKSSDHKIKCGMVARKKVFQYSKDLKFIKDWDSSSEASRELKIQVVNICGAANGTRTSAGGYIWKREKL